MSVAEATLSSSVVLGKRKWGCDVDNCTESFNRPENLKRHKLTIHSGERPYVCGRPGCLFAFKLKQHLKRHYATVHDIEKSFVCDYPDCSESFSQEVDLLRHVCKHTGRDPKRPYVCKFVGCSKAYPFPSKLQAHLSSHQDRVPGSSPPSSPATSFSSSSPSSPSLSCSPSLSSSSPSLSSSSSSLLFPPSELSTPAGSPSLSLDRKTAEAALISEATGDSPSLSCTGSLSLSASDTHTPSLQPVPEASVDSLCTQAVSPWLEADSLSLSTSLCDFSLICAYDGCGKTFSSSVGLRAHQLAHHELRVFHCPVGQCSHAFSYQAEVSRHLKAKHPDYGRAC